MNKIYYLLVLLALILAGCSGNNSTSTDTDNLSSEQVSSSETLSSVTQSSSSTGIDVIPPMSSPYSSSVISSSGSDVISSSSSLQVATAPIAFYKIGAGLAKRLNSIQEMSASTYDIELDTIAMTSSFHFLLKNNGTTPITGIKFTSSLPYFKVTPDSIITLGAPNSNTGMEQLVKVTVEHGTNASGMGFADVLTGNQYATITISGTNGDGDFSVSYTMHVYAKRMVIHIDELDTIAVYTPNGYVFKTKADYANPYQWTPPKFAYVDSSTGDCYMNYVQNQLLVDTALSREFVSVREPYGSDGLDNGIGEDVATKALYGKEVNLYNQLLSSTVSPDMNCVVLVINRFNNTEFIVK